MGVVSKVADGYPFVARANQPPFAGHAGGATAGGASSGWPGARSHGRVQSV